MDLTAVTAPTSPQLLDVASQPRPPKDEAREAFDTFFGETFYGLMLKSLRETTGKSAYFHGGRAEEMFQTQLDQTISQQLAESTAHELTEPMYELFAQQVGR